jgi:hypothetical protein
MRACNICAASHTLGKPDINKAWIGWIWIRRKRHEDLSVLNVVQSE